MGDVINFNQFRKQRERDEKSKKSRENRVKFGRGGAQKAAQRREAEKTAKELDHKSLVPGPEDSSPPAPGTTAEPPDDSTPRTG